MQTIPDKLISAFLEGTLTEQQAAELSQWVQASKGHARYIASLSLIEHGLIKHTKMQSNSDILAEIQETEDNGQELPPIHISSSSPLTKKQVISAMAYLYEHTVTPRRVAIVATAAALLLGVVLGIVLLGGPNDTPPIAEVPDWPDATPDSPPSTLPIVATLTAEHDAVWDRRPGEDLYAGQRFTLTQGFAEITTHRGALAVIEAPTTIEILGDNRVALTRGTLIGHCPTIASRGFTVDTPGAQIVDVGTRFGVAVDLAGDTALEVFTGEVSIAPAIRSGVEPATRVVSGQAASVDGGEVVLTLAPDHSASRFARGIAFERDQWMRGSSLVAYYGFDESGDGVLKESRGKTLFDAEIVGAKWVEGRSPGKHALEFSGEAWEDRVVLSPEASERLKLQGDFTVAMWFKIDSTTEKGWIPLITKGNNSWRILANRSNGPLKIGMFNTVDQSLRSSRKAVTSDEFALDRWHHLVVTGQKDGDALRTRLYLDGALKDEGQLTRVLDNDWPVAFGAIAQDQAEASGIHAFDGQLSEIAFWDHVISEGQIHELYNTESLQGLER